MVYIVVFDFDILVVDVGVDQVVGCGQLVILDGFVFMFLVVNIFYEWVGMLMLVDVNVVSFEVLEVGMYQLIVMNINNGCVDILEVVIVIFEFFDDVNVGVDVVVCDDIFDLSGNLLINGDNIIGVWIIVIGVVIDMLNSLVIMVSGL